jgi:hypothetical protein
MRVLPANLRTTINKIGSGNPYAWLFAIVADEDYPTQSGTAMFLTTYDQELTFANLLPLPASNMIYRPFAAQVGTVQVDTTANTPSVQVSVNNVFREVSYRLEIGDGFMDRRCQFVVVNTAQLSDGALLEGSGYVRAAVATNQAVTFAVELYGLASIEIPQAIYIVDRCRWLSQGGYGGPGCGFPLDLVTGAHDPKYLTCGGTFADCKDRGKFESDSPSGSPVGLGRPRRHPMRFGGFLGLPRLLRR